jgi:hypothetical protein
MALMPRSASMRAKISRAPRSVPVRGVDLLPGYVQRHRDTPSSPRSRRKARVPTGTVAAPDARMGPPLGLAIRGPVHRCLQALAAHRTTPPSRSRATCGSAKPASRRTSSCGRRKQALPAHGGGDRGVAPAGRDAHRPRGQLLDDQPPRSPAHARGLVGSGPAPRASKRGSARPTGRDRARSGATRPSVSSRRIPPSHWRPRNRPDQGIAERLQAGSSAPTARCVAAGRHR